MSIKRLITREVKIGPISLGASHTILPQTMTTTDTMDTDATVAQTIKCIEAGASMVRITAPSKNEAENLFKIKSQLRQFGFHTPLVADIHFTPNAAEIAAKAIEKVRINPGNFVDKKKFDIIDYSDVEYEEELQRIQKRFAPLVTICKSHKTAMRIGTNHGSLSDKIMSRFGDTSKGMVESAMEFLRIARQMDYHDIVLSMKSSNPLVMIDAYRQLVAKMQIEFGECYPLHLGVTEAGDGEDGRIKSALGIGTLLEDGIGDTVRVSLTEPPELEIPVCETLIQRYEKEGTVSLDYQELAMPQLKYTSKPIENIGGEQVPIVMSKLAKATTAKDLETMGYFYNPDDDKWTISDMAADIVLVLSEINTAIKWPENLKWLVPKSNLSSSIRHSYPLYSMAEALEDKDDSGIRFVACSIDELTNWDSKDDSIIFIVSKNEFTSQYSVRQLKKGLMDKGFSNPIIWHSITESENSDKTIIDHTIQSGAPFVDGIGDGVYLSGGEDTTSLLSLSFGILQAVRRRISKTEYISCPSCGRTLFDLQDTTAKIRAATSHLKGLKIAIMGCIVNGPGEMADADFGYVGSGVGKISLYKGKEIVKKNIESEVAVEELINLLKENQAWVDPKH